MIIHRLKVAGFRIIGDATEIEFPEEGPSQSRRSIALRIKTSIVGWGFLIQSHLKSQVSLCYISLHHSMAVEVVSDFPN